MIPMTARYSSKADRPNSMCSKCNGWIDAGTEILHDRNTRRSQHKVCPAQTAPVQQPLAAPAPSRGTVTGAELAVLMFLGTPETRAFLDANDPKSVEQARNALRVNPLAWDALRDIEASNAERAAERVTQEDLANAPELAQSIAEAAAANKTIFDDVAPFIELTDPRVVVGAAASPAPLYVPSTAELDGYKAALVNARTAGDAHAVAALEAAIVAAERAVLNPTPVAPAPTPVSPGSAADVAGLVAQQRAARPPAAPAMGGGNNLRRGRRVAAARFTAAAQARSTPWPDAPAPKPTKVEREDLPF